MLTAAVLCGLLRVVVVVVVCPTSDPVMGGEGHSSSFCFLIAVHNGVIVVVGFVVVVTVGWRRRPVRCRNGTTMTHAGFVVDVVIELIVVVVGGS